MMPAVAVGGLAACFALAAVGVRLLRDEGPILRFDAYDPHTGRAAAGASLPMRAFVLVVDLTAPRAMSLLSPSRRAKIQHRIDAAGKPGGLTIEGYAGRRAVFTALGLGVGVLYLLQGRLVLGLLLAGGGTLLTDLWLSGMARQRQERIERDLPDFLDVLAVTVGAGLGFSEGLRRVSEALGGPLAEEILVALRQVELGNDRRTAFRALQERTDSESLSSFVSAVLQADELGAPLVDTLRQIALDLRRAAHQHARQAAARAAPRVSLVVTLMILPAVVILVAAALFLGTDFGLGELLG